MSRSIAFQPPAHASPRPRLVHQRSGARAWQVVDDLAGLLLDRETDWFHLQPGPDAVLIKQNSHRDVWRVTLGGREFYAKLYHPRGMAARLRQILRGAAAAREWAVGCYAAEHGISTVVPVACAAGPKWDVGPSLLITEALSGAAPLGESWQRVQADRDRANRFIDTLARLIARAHQCGFQHGDMHPGNILVRWRGDDCQMAFVDLHNVKLARPVSPRAVIANLAQLNQWFRRNASRTARLRFLRNYLNCRAQFDHISPHARTLHVSLKELTRRLAVRAERHAAALWAKRDRRIFRDGKYFARLRIPSGWSGHVLLGAKHPAGTASAGSLIYTKSQWRRWLAHPLEWVDPRRVTLLKDSHTATVARAELPVESDSPTAVIVKRPLPRNLWKRIGHAIGPSRNLRAWKLANMLRHRDLPAAQPLAVVERKWAALVRRDSISLTEMIPDAVDLDTLLARDLMPLPAACRRRCKDRLISEVVSLLKAFHERGFVHRDFKAPNLLVTWPPPFTGRPGLTLIDMDGIRHARRVTDQDITRAVARLCVSLLDNPACTHTDRLRFIKLYLSGPGRTADDWKQRWRSIDDAAGIKLKNRRAHQAWKIERYGRL